MIYYFLDIKFITIQQIKSKNKNLTENPII